MGSRIFLMRIAQPWGPLIRHGLQQGAAECAGDGLDGRRPVAVALVAAEAAEVLDELLPSGERRGVFFFGRDGSISGDGLSGRDVQAKARQRSAGETTPGVVTHLQRNV